MSGNWSKNLPCTPSLRCMVRLLGEQYHLVRLVETSGSRLWCQAASFPCFDTLDVPLCGSVRLKCCFPIYTLRRR
jgi:hypothetical protein